MEPVWLYVLTRPRATDTILKASSHFGLGSKTAVELGKPTEWEIHLHVHHVSQRWAFRFHLYCCVLFLSANLHWLILICQRTTIWLGISTNKVSIQSASSCRCQQSLNPILCVPQWWLSISTCRAIKFFLFLLLLVMASSQASSSRTWSPESLY